MTAFTCPPEFITLAQQLVDAARPIARHYFRNDALVVEQKTPHDPVTIADREIESKWRSLIQQHRPSDAIWGEEYGHENQDAEWCWILDPIDGTKAFTVGRATFGCLIGLHHKAHGFVLGIMDQPIMEMRWIGARNQGTQLNGRSIKTKNIPLLQSRGAVTNPMRFSPRLQQFEKRLAAETAFIYAGGECMNFTGIADGSLHFHFDPDQKIYDIAATIPIITEAGGVITHIDGSPIDFAYDHTILAAATPALHAQILEMYQQIPASPLPAGEG